MKKLSSAPAPTDHVGAMLNESRQSIGYDLSQVSHALCIRTLYLQAIEEGRYADLPGTTYAVGFVRTYADYLGLDSDAVVARFKSETAAARDGKRPLAFPEIRPDRPFPSVAVAALSAVLIAGVFAGWVYLREAPQPVTVAIAPPPADANGSGDADGRGDAAAIVSSIGGLEIPISVAAGDPPAPAADADAAPETSASGFSTADAAATIAVPALPAPSSPSSTSSAVPLVGLSIPPVAPIPPIVPADAQLAAPAPLPVAPRPSGIVAVPPARTSAIAASARSLPDPARPEAPAVVDSAGAPTLDALAPLPAVPEGADTAGGAGREYGGANRDARIILTALAESWVQIRDAQQNVVLTRMLQPGDSYRVPNRDDLTLLTGNAGGLEITVDGTAIAPLGPNGAVRRDIALIPLRLTGTD